MLGNGGLCWLGTTQTTVAAATDGYLAADLRVLAQRAQHAALRRIVDSHGGDSDGRVCAEDLKVAMTGFVPASLRGVKLFKSDVLWADVGGLSEVRAALKETLELPLRFHKLFSRAPIRLPSGVLLYGPPGCGKTMVRSAACDKLVFGWEHTLQREFTILGAVWLCVCGCVCCVTGPSSRPL